MGELDGLRGDLSTQCQRFLSAQGRLSTAIDGFHSRAAQIELAVEIAKVLEEKGILIAEAGTGTGKTFAYLLPALLSGEKAIISTATKTLQDQLFYKDLPTLIRALGISAKIQNLKGRSNYICRYRVELHSEEGRFQSAKDAKSLQLIRKNIGRLVDGVRTELPQIPEDASVWPMATSTTDNCLGSECPSYQDCFIVKARRKAMDADIVVINHHLFFADARLKEDGFGELLPGVGLVVFDEAHQLADIASQFDGEQLSTRQLVLLFNDIMREWPLTDLSHQPFKNVDIKLGKIIDAFLLAIPGYEERSSWDKYRRHRAFHQAWTDLSILVGGSIETLQEKDFTHDKGLEKCFEQLLDVRTLMQNFDKAEGQAVFWIERFKKSLRFHKTPFDVAESFSRKLHRMNTAYVFTSATMTISNRFDCFTRPLGLEKARTLQLASPFEYREQSLLYLPRGIPDPKNKHYPQQLLEAVLPVINACGGRCFFLFTSHRALKELAELIQNRIKFPLFVQGEESKTLLLEKFRQAGNAVLLGTASFWEGVDVKGEALSCVIIDKIPFASPMDPVVQGKAAYLRRKGMSEFDYLSLPNAVIALKQGVGRLIRDETDRGILVIADPRLTGRPYGKVIFESLPDLVKTRERQKALAFIEKLALPDEISCN